MPFFLLKNDFQHIMLYHQNKKDERERGWDMMMLLLSREIDKAMEGDRHPAEKEGLC